MKVGRKIGRIIDRAMFRLGQGPARASQIVRETIFRSGAYALSLKGRTPVALATLPAPWTEAESDANTLMAGFLVTGGRRVPFDDAPWAGLPADSSIRAAANGFQWLPILAQGETQAHLDRARRLVDTWLDANDRWSPDAWALDVLADRLSVWSHWLDVILAGEDHSAMRNRSLRSFMAQFRHLARSGPDDGPRDWRAFAVCRGLIRCALAVSDDAGASPAAGLRRLSSELDRQILPDGGHFQRSPSIHLRVFSLLVDIRNVLAESRTEAPPALQGAIDRMAPLLRLFRLGDGGLTVVNGGHEETRRAVDDVLDRSGSKGKGTINAPHTGFQRIAAGSTVIIADTGTPPPPGAQATAHAGPLAFEMSAGPHRVVVNCGAPAGVNGGASSGSEAAWVAAARATAAHSTVGIDDTNAVEFLPGGRIGVGPTEVLSQRRESDGAIWLDTEHNGYVETMGTRHKRRFFLSAGGDDFRGEDILEGVGGKTFRARFHLHPQVQASLIQGGTGVLLRLPGGTGWRFFANGGTVSLEDSIYLGAGGRHRRTEQIVVSGLLDGRRTSIKWRFAKVGG